jgi:hypothetical protein
MSFDRPLEPLTPRQRAVVLAVALFCAATRFLAMARTVWEWDEALFTMAMRDFDVTLHHPHPPGFPVYIALAKLVRLVVADDFRALQAVNLAAAVLVFPALFLFARELRLRFVTAVSAAALFAFFPNVWFFGGGAFSDIPSIVLVLFAVTFLLRGRRSRNAYWIGTVLLALAIGIRPQNFLVGLVPGLLATRRRRWWEILAALVIGVVIVGVAFGGATYATGSLHEYTQMIREHGNYISRVDSWRSEGRPPLWRIFDRFFVKQYQSPVLSGIASLFVAISLVGSIRNRDRSMFWNAMTFLLFAIFAWLMLDRFSISRFSIGYQPMFALFVADGIRRVALWSSGLRSDRRPGPSTGEPGHVSPSIEDDRRGRLSLDGAARREVLLSAALVAAFLLYTLPALTDVRNEIAPSIRAAQTAAQRIDSERDQLFVGHSMVVFMDLVAPGKPYTRVLDDRAMPIAAGDRAWLLAEVTTTAEDGTMFRRERGRLWNIARRHYFEVKLAPITARPRFIAGWYAPESMETNQWRWMKGQSVTMLPPVRGEAILHMQFGVPGELIPHKPTITVRLNGRVIGTIAVTSDAAERDFHLQPAPQGLPNILEVSIDRTVLPVHDSRELGLRLRHLTWGPA